MMKPGFSIIKISERLCDFEREAGVFQIKPVWGYNLDVNEYLDYASRKLYMYGSLVSPGELGCSLAHIEAYRKTIKLGIPSLILEDDIALTSDTLHELTRLTRRFDGNFIHLADYSHLKKYGIRSDNDLYVVSPYLNFWGSSAYWVSPKAARLLLAFQSRCPLYADDWAMFFSSFGKSLTPYYYPLFQHEWRIDGLVQERNRMKPITIKAILGRKLLRLGIKFSALFDLLRYPCIAPFCPIPNNKPSFF